MILVSGHDVAVAAWAVEQIPHVRDVEALGPFAAMGVADGEGLLAACVYHRWVPEYGTCEITFAARSARWATRGLIRGLLAVPFDQYGCYSVVCVVPHDHARAEKFVKGIGFVREGCRRHGFGPKRHALIYGMTKPEYERLFRRLH